MNGENGEAVQNRVVVGRRQKRERVITGPGVLETTQVQRSVMIKNAVSPILHITNVYLHVNLNACKFALRENEKVC